MQSLGPDQDIVGWVVKGLAGLVMFLLAIGIKDIRDRLRDAEMMVAKVQILEDRIKQLEREIDTLRKNR